MTMSWIGWARAGGCPPTISATRADQPPDAFSTLPARTGPRAVRSSNPEPARTTARTAPERGGGEGGKGPGKAVVATTEEPRQLVRGREAVAKTHRVDLVPPFAPAYRSASSIEPHEDRPFHRFGPLRPEQRMPVVHGNAVTRKLAEVAQPVADEVRTVREGA